MRKGELTARLSWRRQVARTEILRSLLRSTMTPLVLASLLSGSLTCPAFSQPPASSSSSSHLRGNVSFNKISGPEAGVALLERIFNRVMSIPQIAIAKPAPKQSPAEKENAGVDYALAIRPKETGKIFSQSSPSLRVLPTTKLDSMKNTRADQSNENLGESIPEPPPFYGAPQSNNLAGASSTMGATAGGSGIVLQDEESVDSWKGGNLLRAPGKARDVGQMLKAEADRLGIWDKDMSVCDGLMDKSARQSGSLPPTNMGKFVHQPGDNACQASQSTGVRAGASSASYPTWSNGASRNRQTQLAQQPPDLQSAIGRLYGAAKKMEEAQRLVDAPAEKKEKAPPQSNVTTVSSEQKQKAKFYNSPRQIQMLDERPAVHDFRSAPEGISTKLKDIQIAQGQNKAPYYAPAPAPMSRRNSPAPGGFAAGATASNAAGYKLPNNAIPAQILSIEDASNTLRKQQGATSPGRANAIASQLYNQMMSDNNRSGMEKRETIALLPPNVATGIPLVSLGTSQMQVASALSNMGQLKEQKINRWSVMTWKKPETGTTALQLFFRNGLLDAIRIFDPTLVAQDFGVAPGDSLERVKEKFGEPAFLLQEPTAGMGQNYIYPISQVGFQLARGSGNTPPKVVSILIFSVK